MKQAALLVVVGYLVAAGVAAKNAHAVNDDAGQRQSFLSWWAHYIATPTEIPAAVQGWPKSTTPDAGDTGAP